MQLTYVTKDGDKEAVGTNGVVYAIRFGGDLTISWTKEKKKHLIDTQALHNDTQESMALAQAHEDLISGTTPTPAVITTVKRKK